MIIKNKRLDGEELLSIRDALLYYRESGLTEVQWEITQNIISRIENVLIQAYEKIKEEGEEDESKHRITLRSNTENSPETF